MQEFDVLEFPANQAEAFYIVNADDELSEDAVVVQPFRQVKWKGNLSVLLFRRPLGKAPGTTVVGSVGGLSEGTGVLAHRVARNAQLSSDFTQRDALNFGLLHRPPQRQLTRRLRTFLQSLGFWTRSWRRGRHLR